MANPTDKRWAELLDSLREYPALPGQLTGQEGEIIRQALDELDVHEIAQAHGIPETAVWEIVGNAARAAKGENVDRVETGGMGSDTDPGGYGETGFGVMGNEPPEPTFEEPDSKKKSP